MIKIELIYKILNQDSNSTVKHILKDKLKISSRLIVKLKFANKIYVNDKEKFVNYIVKEGDTVKAVIDFEEEDHIEAEKMDLSVIYEDEYILAINKPAGIVVHPSANHQTGTLANGVKYYLNNKRKIRPINRLDRDTSGIVLFAKDEYTQERFIEVSYNTSIKKYIAYVDGIMENMKRNNRCSNR